MLLVGCATADPPRVDLGASAASWSPLADGDPIELHLGAQGGHHLLASARIDGLWPGEREDGTDDPRVGFTVTAPDGAVWSAALPAVRRPFVACAAGGYQLDGGSRIYLVDGAEVLDGTQVLLEVDVVDASGASASDARLVTVRVIDDR